MRWRALAGLGAASLAVWAWACSSSSGAPTGKDDTLIVDVDATNIPGQTQPDAGDTDSPFGTYYGDAPSGAYDYSPTSVCSKCACEAGTYCFGGGTGFTTFSGTCSGSSGLAVGCQPLPAACVTAAASGKTEECACLFSALKAQVPCTPECTQGKSVMVYCPSP
jgi:hypothetical protein